MALLDIIKKKKGDSRFEEKQREKADDVSGAGKKEEKKGKEVKTKKTVKDEKKSQQTNKGMKILIGTHVTEKTTFLNEKGVYVFKVGKKANKIMIKKAIKEAYGVTPEKIAVVNAPSKTRFVRGRRGVKSGFRKAMIYLKKGDKIEA